MNKATRQAFGESLLKLGQQYPEIVVLDADLSQSTKSNLFAQKFPHRFFEMGIAEANMIGTAAGLSFAGYLPFLCSFGCFLTGRYDTIRLSVAYSQANVRLIGTHAGLGVGEDGYSQMALEDFALMRALPNMGVFQPMDAQETELLLEYLVTQWKKPAYVRLTRQALPHLYPVGKPFQATQLMSVYQEVDSTPIVCLATGAGVAEAIEAAKILNLQGIAMGVWNVHCLKPFDHQSLIALLPSTQCIVSVEDHSVIGGLGSCIEETLAKLKTHPPLIKFGVQDQFGESGAIKALYEKFGLSGEKIAQTLKEWVERA